MDKILLEGGKPLNGSIQIGGAKNAVLPILAAGLLTDQPLQLDNVPALADVRSMQALLRTHGMAIEDGEGTGDSLTLVTKTITNHTADYELVRKMRASVLVLGPLLARTGVAKVSLPGGCAIGQRPVDLHLKGLEEMGAEIELDRGYINARAPKGLRGASVPLAMPSVGATENLLMAAALAEGETVITNAAREPEIVDLATCLQAMGARIEGAGSATITIEGVPALHGARHRVVADRIELGTYAIAAAITSGELKLLGGRAELIGSLVEKLVEAGVGVTEEGDDLVVSSRGGRPAGVDVMTQPFPGFPTDLQAQFMALMCIAEGAAMITETIFENRFMHVSELGRMGAKITVHGGSALVRGVDRLHGAQVMATDLRASVSLILAGLAATGETEIRRVYHLDRGYEKVDQKLRNCGAVIERMKE
ncbi:MAG: UDP-N-acetylglucosamine 1-carboxyvinyltransferase [Alphaproteobacteria bacterium]|nr:UDP-N-acetylglucosamine 1-carboxyvinyltransferase [Alphaproteobacteria bacterium]